LDGIVGLFPGVGDLVGTLVSALVIASATQAGLPRAAVARMMANVVVDTLLGSIPFLGDLFDFAFKANIGYLRS
jgi:predicted ABC-type sugar transport system permease subunit